MRRLVSIAIISMFSILSLFAQASSYIVDGIDWGNASAKVSTYFTVGEVFTTGTSIDWNRRNALFALPIDKRNTVIRNIRAIAAQLDGIRGQIGPIKIMSWYRDEATNARVGGASDSQHIYGHGVDIRALQYDGASLESWLEQNWNGGVGRGWAKRGFTHIDLGTNRRWDY